MKKIIFLGDFFYDYDYVKEDIKELSEFIKRNDYDVILNLEGTYKTDKPLVKWITLKQNRKVIEILKMLNVKAVNIANNHMLDWQENGLKRMIKDLENNSIPYFGAGLNLSDALKPLILEYEELKVGLLGFGWWLSECVPAKKKSAGVAPLKRKLVLKQVNDIKDKVDRIVVNLHWGYEYEKYPLPIHREFAHELIDSGVDLIIGHHPHVIQAKETYKNKGIYYSLGNFYFGSRRKRHMDIPIDKTNTARYGMGVVLNLEMNKTSELYFDSNYEFTTLIDNINVEDISDVPMDTYNQYFRDNKTSNKKKPYFYSKDIFKNNVKEIYYKMKVNVRSVYFYTLKQLGIYDSYRDYKDKKFMNK